MCNTEKKVEKLKVKSFSVMIFLGQQSALSDISLYIPNKNNLTIQSTVPSLMPMTPLRLPQGTQTALLIRIFFCLHVTLH